jgi:scyllo-inositol 2-dehydrogenase (NADP+)
MAARVSGTIRTGVIGFGTSGAVFHAPFLAADPDYSLDLVVTSDPDRRAEALGRHPGVQVVSTAEELFARADELDLVVVGSPSGTHAALATAALDAGLHVVVDKPFAVTAAEGRAVVDRAAAADRLVTVFQNRRWDGDFLTVRRLLDEGALGHVHRFESRFEWWKPDPPASWKTAATAAEGGGILYDLGTHVIDQAIRLFGEVEDVHAELGVVRPGAVADDDAFVALRHRSGVRSHLWMGSLVAQAGPRFRILGSSGAYTSWGLDGQEPALKAGADPRDEGFGRRDPSGWGSIGNDGATEPVPMADGDYAAFTRLLATALHDGGPPPVDPADAIAVLEIIEAVHAAAAPHERSTPEQKEQTA